ncbi:MAG: DGQHR domain-containing protein [Lachnospiraceae bacterium]
MKKVKKRKPLSEDQLMARAKSAFKRKIKNIFTGVGFTYIPVNDHEMTIGFRKVEVDSLFIFENIWILCEDTVKTTDIKDHIRTKNEAFGEIKQNLSNFIVELEKLFPEQKNIFSSYDVARIKVFGLYIPRYKLDLNANDYKMFTNLLFVQPQTLSYFQWIVQAIKFSARNEIFRFLNLKNSDIGIITSGSKSTQIKAPIIYPQAFTGRKDNVRIVSFMMSAEDLLNTSYVLRKDNWEQSIWLYQRLIEKNKIKKIREFLVKKGVAFYNNIIVALPDSVAFIDGARHYKNANQIGDLEGNCELILPREMNSICVIDGQHRIFAHYESGVQSKQEDCISKLRKQLHLLVTGLVFPPEMPTAERVRIQSEIFLEINSNAKPVPPNVLLQIKRIKDPIADESIAQFVIEKLNEDGVFRKKFQLSSLDEAPIKTASIVRFALRYLVTIHPSEGKKSLYDFWGGNKTAIHRLDEDALEEYTRYCSTVIRNYFGAIRKHFKEQWDDPNSKLLSVISINGFVIALTRQLSINGVQEFDFYDRYFEQWQCDFSKDGFSYTSSQYKKFSSEILEQVFKLTPEEIENL